MPSRGTHNGFAKMSGLGTIYTDREIDSINRRMDAGVREYGKDHRIRDPEHSI